MADAHNTSLNRTLLRLAIPTIFMNISLPLLGAVDTAVVGHLPEIYHVGAVGVGAMLFNVLYWSFGFFRMSTVGLAAQSHGAQTHAETLHILLRGIGLGIVVGLLVILLREAFTTIAFQVIKASPQVRLHAEEYVHIRAWAAPAVFVNLVFTGWFFGIKNVRFPVVVTLVVNGFNIGLDFWFVVGLGLTSDGVAWATVIAQYAGLVTTLGYFWWAHRGYLTHFHMPALLDWPRIRAILEMNRDIFLRTQGLLFVQVMFTAYSAAMGDLVLAANTILIQYRYITGYALDGFAVGAEVLVGSAKGRGNRAELLAAIRLSLIWGFVGGAGFAAVYGLLGNPIASLFTSNQEVLGLVAIYLIWAVVEPLVSNFCYMLDGVFVGATATRMMRNSMIFAAFGVFLPVFLWWENSFGNHGMLAAVLVFNGARGILLGYHTYRLSRSPEYKLV